MYLDKIKKDLYKKQKTNPSPTFKLTRLSRAAANDMNISNNEQNLLYTCFVSPI